MHLDNDNTKSTKIKTDPIAQRLAPTLLQNPAAAAPIVGQTFNTLWQALQNPSNVAGASGSAAPAGGRHGPLREYRDVRPSRRGGDEASAGGWFGNSRAASGGPAAQRKSGYANVNADADSIFNSAFSPSPNSNTRKASGSSQQQPRYNDRGFGGSSKGPATDESGAGVVNKLARWMGADLGASSSPPPSSKQSRR